MCDSIVSGPLKTAYRQQVEQLYGGGINIVMKQRFTLQYRRAYRATFMHRNAKQVQPTASVLFKVSW